jgi:ubiquinol-cytochrome c reductase iron-sulfur subunit
MRRERAKTPRRGVFLGMMGARARNEIVATSKTVTTEHTRRDFLYIATASVGAVGAAAVAWPLISSMNPDASVLALSSTEVDLTPVAVGQIITVKWQGKPVFISHRTKKEIQEAQDVKLSELPDPQPDSARVKKGKDEWLVVIGICTHLGCVPIGHEGEYHGWFCPCHGSQYDTSGRIRKGPAPLNLALPPYEFTSDKTIKIG